MFISYYGQVVVLGNIFKTVDTVLGNKIIQ